MGCSSVYTSLVTIFFVCLFVLICACAPHSQSVQRTASPADSSEAGSLVNSWQASSLRASRAPVSTTHPTTGALRFQTRATESAFWFVCFMWVLMIWTLGSGLTQQTLCSDSLLRFLPSFKKTSSEIAFGMNDAHWDLETCPTQRDAGIVRRGYRLTVQRLQTSWTRFSPGYFFWYLVSFLKN